MNTRDFGGGDDLLIRCVGDAVGDIVAQSSIEQKDILQYEADVLTQGALCYLAQVVSIDGQASLCGIVKAWEQAQNRAFATTSCAEQGDNLPRFGVDVDIM